MRQIAEFVAVLACGLFAGAAVYVSLVEHPARMACGVEIATAEFFTELSPGNYRAGDFGGLGSFVFHSRMACRGDILVARWRCRAGAVIPFTLIVILPTNKQLLDRNTVQAVSPNGEAGADCTP